MLDGQNLSDPRLAFAGTWDLPATLEALASNGLETIVVGIHNTGAFRLSEYSPWPDSRMGGGKGHDFSRFLARTLKPRIDRTFRTKVDRRSNVVAGSSMGGLIALYTAFRHRLVFGGAAALSPALWFGDREVFGFVKRSRRPAGKLYVDVGTAEGRGALRDVRAFRRLLLDKGFEAGSLEYVEADGAPHSESAWAERLPGALTFLLAEDRASR
jgi:predicted alpha/beta superfamily hydrolase